MAAIRSRSGARHILGACAAATALLIGPGAAGAGAVAPVGANAMVEPEPAVADPGVPDAATPAPDATTPAPEPPLPVYPVDLTVEQSVPPAIGPGRAWTYEVVVTNNGTAPVSGARLTTSVPEGLGTAAWTCDPGGSAACLAGSSGRGAAIDAAADLLPGSQVTFTVAGTRPSLPAVDPAAAAAPTSTVAPSTPWDRGIIGDGSAPAATVVVDSTVTVVPPPGAVDGDPSDNADSAELSLTPWWLDVRQATRSAAGAGLSRASGGQAVTYVIAVSNLGIGVSEPATFVADLAGVLDDATWLGDVTVTGSGTDVGTDQGSWTDPGSDLGSGAGAAPLFDAAAQTLTWWTQVARGGRTSLQFSVAVAAQPAGDSALVSDVSSVAVGSSCPADPGATSFRGRGCESVVRVDAAPIESPTADSPTPTPVLTPTGASPGAWFSEHGGEVAVVAGAALAALVGAIALGTGVTAYRRRVRGLR